ncbi:outer membrane protein assembly factor BamD [Prosthecobacter sp. SYSU 5D2]|uniref:outer membrane protein assembly factor BamD n=1 Tax=Prosthecobacter sp. SYSU 5D2 TaxID=3134134 RepID=UPI0031FF361B
MSSGALTAFILRSPVFAGLLCFFVCAGPCPGREDDQARVLYARAQKLLSEGDPDEALDRYLTLLKKHPRTEWSALSLWDMYRIYIHQDSPEPAFEVLNRLIVEQPGHFEKAHAAQLQLVQRILGSGKEARTNLESVKKKKPLPPEIVVEMLKTVIKNGPHSEVGIQAHYYLAIAREQAGEKTEAIAAHEDFAETYSSHELADDAGYQSAYIAYKSWKSMRSTGPHQRENAAVALAWFIARFPESDKAAQARSCLAEVRAAELSELLGLARYYEARSNPKAALIYYQQIASRFPEVIQTDEVLRDKILSLKGAEEVVGPVR